MSSASAFSVALAGLEGTLVEVEAATGGGLPRVVMVGLPDTALYQARDRCKAAVTSAGLSWPSQLVTINLTPATLPKAGSHYDLAIVTAVLASCGAVPVEQTHRLVLMGEVGLDGRVRAVRGILPGLMAAMAAGKTTAVVPRSQLSEALLVEGLTVWGVDHLVDLIEVLNGRPVISEVPSTGPEAVEVAGDAPDLADVVGQHEARFALEVAAAGRHHLFMHGAPGLGKTMLASRLPGVLPNLELAEALEVSALHSLADEQLNDGLIIRPPYCAPHHSISLAALVGGGIRVARPGAISRAHRGVLFLDEAPEFGARALEALRTPLESGWVTLGRSQQQVSYPARFQLVLAANPCPCGQAGSAESDCTCAPMSIRRYADRLSGPILDRIDLQLQLPPHRTGLLAGGSPGESTSVVAARVADARERQQRRLAPYLAATNAEVTGATLRKRLPLPEGVELLETALRRGKISARGLDKVLRVAWTIADLAGKDAVARAHLRTALSLRRGISESVAA